MADLAPTAAAVVAYCRAHGTTLDEIATPESIISSMPRVQKLREMHKQVVMLKEKTERAMENGLRPEFVVASYLDASSLEMEWCREFAAVLEMSEMYLLGDEGKERTRRLKAVILA